MTDFFKSLVNNNELVINLSANSPLDGIRDEIYHCKYVYEQVNKEFNMSKIFIKMVANELYDRYKLKLHKDYEFSKESFMGPITEIFSDNKYYVEAFVSIIVNSRALKLLKLSYPEINEVYRTNYTQMIRLMNIADYYRSIDNSFPYTMMGSNLAKYFPELTWDEIYTKISEDIKKEMDMNVYE